MHSHYWRVNLLNNSANEYNPFNIPELMENLQKFPVLNLNNKHLSVRADQYFNLNFKNIFEIKLFKIVEILIGDFIIIVWISFRSFKPWSTIFNFGNECLSNRVLNYINHKTSNNYICRNCILNNDIDAFIYSVKIIQYAPSNKMIMFDYSHSFGNKSIRDNDV